MTATMTASPQPATDSTAPPADRGGPAPQRRSSSVTRVFVAIALFPAVGILGLLAFAGFLSLREDGLPSGAFTLENYVSLFSNPQLLEVIANTIVYVASTAVGALVLGTCLALVVERTDFGFARTINTLILLRVLIPSFLTAMGWLFLLHPRIGAINIWFADLFGLEEGPFNIVSLTGMGFIEGLSLSGLVFMMVSASLSNMDGSLEESARTNGAGPFAVLMRVTIPLMRPAIISSVMFVSTIAVSALDVPLVIGLSNRLYVFSTYLYLASSPATGVANYGAPAAFSTVLILVALGLSVWYTRTIRLGSKYQVLSGKGYRPVRARLSRSGRALAAIFVLAYFLFAILLPLLMVVWASLLKYLQPPSIEALAFVTLDNYLELNWASLLSALGNTLQLSILAPTIVVLISVAYAYIVVRSRLRSRYAFDFVAFVPQAVPNTIFAFSAALVVMHVLNGWLYGSIALIIIVMALTQLPFGSRSVNAALLQIHPELEESAAMSGGTAWQTLMRVTAALLRPVLLYTWLWLMLLAMRDLTLPVMLASPGSMTLSLASWSLFTGGAMGAASAVTVLTIIAMSPVIIVFLLLSRKNEGSFGS